MLGRGATEVQDSRLVQHMNRDGTALAYEDTGAGDPPFVFVHGWTCNHTHFAPQVEHFGRQHRTVAVDLRGHGASAAPEQDYTISGFADDVAWLCEQLGVERPILVGHSMGGTVVLDVAARYPDLPRAVVMVDAAPIVGSSPSAEMAAEIAAALRGPGRGRHPGWDHRRHDRRPPSRSGAAGPDPAGHERGAFPRRQLRGREHRPVGR